MSTESTKFVYIYSDKHHIRIEDRSTKVVSYMLKNSLVIQQDNAETFFLKNDSYVKYIKFANVAHPKFFDTPTKLLDIIIDMLANEEVQNEIISVNEMEEADIVLDLSVNTDKNEYHIAEKISNSIDSVDGITLGTATVTYNTSSHYVEMNINDIEDSGSNVIVRQSKSFVNIPSGKLNISLISGTMISHNASVIIHDELDMTSSTKYKLSDGAPTPTISPFAMEEGTYTSKMGIFDDTLSEKQGLRMEFTITNDGAQITDSFNIIRTINGTEESPIPQLEWNIDTCDTLGPSGIRLKASDMNTFIFRCGTLPKTFMQVGVMHNGAAILIHEFTDSEYFVKLPLRWEVEQSIASGDHLSPFRMIQNNAVVLSNEKHYSQTMTRNYICQSGHFRKINDESPEDVVFDIRLNPTYKRSKIKLEKISIINLETNGIVLWKLYRNGLVQNNSDNTDYDLSGIVTKSHADIVSLSSTQVWTTITDDTTGAVTTTFVKTDYLKVTEVVGETSLISSGYIYGNSVTEINLESDTNIIYADIDGVSDNLTLVAYYVNTPAELQASITWKEYE
ncbi:hypothetical protein QKU58_gp146 [Pyramimonas orientalis virus]|uniref:Uncharacterized protein n=1 Tax=Pyramimonas orientalis virus 01B TaxID=3134525 RepID=A0A7M4CES5_9VIRU|nr:hypothetical protein QKU58_gp146 [Pyramimonas orientalis virus]QOI90185.1 hypothetical protein HWQ62_00048 [Pyramimonas orientalis virus]